MLNPFVQVHICVNFCTDHIFPHIIIQNVLAVPIEAAYLKMALLWGCAIPCLAGRIRGFVTNVPGVLLHEPKHLERPGAVRKHEQHKPNEYRRHPGAVDILITNGNFEGLCISGCRHVPSEVTLLHWVNAVDGFLAVFIYWCGFSETGQAASGNCANYSHLGLLFADAVEA